MPPRSGRHPRGRARNHEPDGPRLGMGAQRSRRSAHHVSCRARALCVSTRSAWPRLTSAVKAEPRRTEGSGWTDTHDFATEDCGGAVKSSDELRVVARRLVTAELLQVLEFSIAAHGSLSGGGGGGSVSSRSASSRSNVLSKVRCLSEIVLYDPLNSFTSPLRYPSIDGHWNAVRNGCRARFHLWSCRVPSRRSAASQRHR